MTMRLAWVNRFDDAIIEAGSRTPNLPPQNLRDPHMPVKWFSETGVTSTHILADIGSSQPIGAVCVLGTNLTSAATLRVRGSISDNTGIAGEVYDSGTLSNVIDDDYPNFYHVFNDVSARYWRINITDDTLLNLRAGRVFIGPTWVPTKAMQFGWGMTWADASRRTKSRGGQSYIDVGYRFRVMDFTLSFMDQSEMYTNAFELARRNGLNQDILVVPDDQNTLLHEISIFGLVTSSFPITHSNFNVYQQKYRVEERI